MPICPSADIKKEDTADGPLGCLLYPLLFIYPLIISGSYSGRDSPAGPFTVPAPRFPPVPPAPRSSPDTGWKYKPPVRHN